MKKFSSLEEYLNAQTEEGRQMLSEIRDIIHNTLPNIEESMSYGAPTFNLKPNAKYDDKLMMAGYKNHISFYPNKVTLDVFKDRLKDYKVLKGTIQIMHNEKIPKGLIKDMVNHSYKMVNKIE